MSFLYPHTLAVSRPNGVPWVGSAGYGALSRADETVIVGTIDDAGRAAAGVAAAGRPGNSGGQPAARVPSDATGRSTPWRFIVRPCDLPPGSVKMRDIVTDETGQRYQVIIPTWNPLECSLRVEPLAA